MNLLRALWGALLSAALCVDDALADFDIDPTHSEETP